jgi:arylsulfatase A-like enzyme
MPGPEDTYQSYGHGWANLSNTPFRLFKQHDHEGGIHTPLIVHWPRGVMARGAVTFQRAHLIDVMPTALAVAGVKRPEKTDAGRSHPLDGGDLAPIFAGRDRGEPVEHYFANARGQAIRRGDWKLVSVRAGRKKPVNWELYNLREDPTELNDLAEQLPDRVRELASAFERWIKQSQKRP